MRIIAGKLGGRKIGPVKGNTRPAMGMTREALFSMLCARGLDFEKLQVLDIFAGSGSLGFEAISRGAVHADFVDNSPDLCKALHANAQNLGIEGQCGIYCEAADKFLSRRAISPYGLVFVDPPYRKKLNESALARVCANGYAMSGTFVCAEAENDAKYAVPDCLALLVSRTFGQTVLNIWRMI